MILQPKPPLTVVLPKVPLPAALRASLLAHASSAGVSESEAVRQWLTAYLAQPRILASAPSGSHEARLPPSGLPVTSSTRCVPKRSGRT